MSQNKKFNVVSKSLKKIDGISLAKGEAKFVDDIFLKDLLFVKILHSPFAHAEIVDIDTTKAEKLKGVHCILTYKNVPRVLHTTAGQGYPEPSPYDTYMFDKKVRFVGDRVLALAADSPEIAEEAVQLIKVKYKLLTPVFDPIEAMKPTAPRIHEEPDPAGIAETEKNIAGKWFVEMGDIDEGFKSSDLVYEQTYKLTYTQHCAIEPHICITYLDEQGRLIIRTSTQVPFHCRRICANVLQIPIQNIRVIKPKIGGGFGSKQEVFLEYICGAVTLKTARPAKLEYSRPEVFFASRTNHPAIIKLKMGVKKTGEIQAIDYNVITNTGAYGTHALTILTCTGSRPLPLYNKVKNVRFDGKAVYTNLPVAGAYRGYGATQGFFAFEIFLDEIAEKLNIDPIQLRKKNCIKENETSEIFELMGEGRHGVAQIVKSCKLDKCIEIGAKEINWYKKRKTNGSKKYGVGMCILMQASGIPAIDMGGATMKMNEDGSFNLFIGATDLGTGADTVLAQIAAEVLQIPLEKIIVYAADTDITPFDTGAYASSTTYISGGAVKKAAEKIKQQIIFVASKILDEEKENLFLKDGNVISNKTKKSVSYENICRRAMYSKEQFQIMATESHYSMESPPPFAAHFCEVEVDEETGIIKVVKYVAAVDCGTAINPKLAEGQVEGAVLNGISYALTEELIFDREGRVLNPNFLDYKIFSTRDIPEIKTILIPSYEPSGPFGAKSISEININGPAPAISNAVYNACGIRLRETPFTPEKVLKLIKSK